MVALGLLAACTSGPTGQSGQSATPSAAASAPARTLGARLRWLGLPGIRPGVPSCGVLWGLATKPPTAAGTKAVEDLLGRRFDFVYRYHDVNDVIPDAAEKAQVAGGQLLHISVATRDFSDAGSALTWKDIAEGTYDTQLSAQARGIASLGVPVFVTFEQEANQKAKQARYGSPEDFVAAWRHVHDLYAAAGATNAVWVWVMTGSADNLASAGEMWPGNDQVDWISWNVYNQSGCATGSVDTAKSVSFEEKMRVFYDWVTSQGPGLGIDAAKPMMISETGSAKFPGDLGKTADWYAAIPSVLTQSRSKRLVSGTAWTAPATTGSTPSRSTDAVRSAGRQRPASAQPTPPAVAGVPEG